MSTFQPSDELSTKGLVASGVAQFAGVMLSILGVLQILQGIAAIAKDSVFTVGVKYIYEFDVTAWGWIHLFIGVVSVAVGIAIIAERTVGYLAGIAVASLGAVANFAFLPYQPWWSLLLIAFDVLVIWALCTQLSLDRVDDDYYARQDAATRSSASAGGAGPDLPHQASPATAAGTQPSSASGPPPVSR
jgi:hypothetical protein